MPLRDDMLDYEIWKHNTRTYWWYLVNDKDGEVERDKRGVPVYMGDGVIAEGVCMTKIGARIQARRAYFKHMDPQKATPYLVEDSSHLLNRG